MNSIEVAVTDPDWRLDVEVDDNIGGDGRRVGLFGDARSFRMLAAILTEMAETVDNPRHPSHSVGWHIAFNPNEIKQINLINASILTLNCEPKTSRID
jgi:hypothetical protein